MGSDIVIFHGGCHGCTQQLDNTEGVDFCIKCQYFEAEWSLPDLNNRPETDVERIRIEVKSRQNRR